MTIMDEVIELCKAENREPTREELGSCLKFMKSFLRGKSLSLVEEKCSEFSIPHPQSTNDNLFIINENEASFTFVEE
ncbi:MAG TPA: hypothetical protein VKE88_02785 [Candidatus Nanoarchaeia archaeon]|nr:hypothetical protein [Candidatus Nanoarchaeia archaeon]